MTGWDSEEDAIRRRIEALIRMRPGVTCAFLSQSLGKNRAYIHQYLRRGQPRRLHHRDRIALAGLLGVRLAELGVEPVAPDGFAESDAGAIIFVPAMEDMSDAIGGRNSYPFRRDHLESLSAAPDMLMLYRLCGDSMMPTLADGDLVLIDRSVAEGRREGLYLIMAAGMRLVRRISANPLSGRLRIRSDNPLGESPSECAPGKVQIIGRVVWAGKRL